MTGQKIWAVGEEVLAPDFNNYVQSQIVAQFANVATRDSQWTSPPNGAMCVTTDTNTVWQRVAGAWAPVAGSVPWITPTMTGGWVAYGAPFQTPRYRKIGDIVYIEGWIKSGTIGQPAFTLPAGYRALASNQFVTASQGAIARVATDTTGAVTPAAGGTNDFIINFSFSTL